MSFNFSEIFTSGAFISLSENELWVGWGKAERQSQPDAQRLSFYAPDYFLKDDLPWWIFPSSCRITREDLIRECQKFVTKKPLNIQVSEEPDFDFFETLFLELKDELKKGVLKKAVLIGFQKYHHQLTITDRATLISHLLSYTQSAPLFPYGIWNPSEGMLGASPEILFRKIEGPHFVTAALAGTRFRTEARQECLLEDPKEREEHRIVVDAILKGLQEIGVECVEEGALSELSLPTLTHLYTPISFQVKLGWQDREFFEKLVRALHPTPALGAYPKQEGFIWLRRMQEREDRKRFGAPFGARIGDLKAICLVGIRNIQWDLHGMQVGAGCGIVLKSELKNEMQEIKGKLQAVQMMLGMDTTSAQLL